MLLDIDLPALDGFGVLRGLAARGLLPELPVLVLAGDQDPVANYGEGAYHVANRLVASGHPDVRTRVFPGVRHEVHNEPTTRAEAEQEIVAFVSRVSAPSGPEAAVASAG